MPRMYGENAQRYAQRQLGNVGRREVNEAYAARPKVEIEIEPWCTCRVKPYPHRHADWERRLFEIHRRGTSNVVSARSMWDPDPIAWACVGVRVGN